jgi:kynureninase
MIDIGVDRLDEALIARRIRPLFSRALAPGRPIYLANHSLGRPPDRVAEDVQRALDAWYRDMGEAWDEWLGARERFRALTARLVGVADAGSIVPKTSAGQGLRAVLNSFEPGIKVLSTDAEFDSLDFILRVYREKGRTDLATVPARAEALIDELKKKRTALAVVSTVLFRSAEIVPGIESVIRAAHAAARASCSTSTTMPGADARPRRARRGFRGRRIVQVHARRPGRMLALVHPRHHARRTLDTAGSRRKTVRLRASRPAAVRARRATLGSNRHRPCSRRCRHSPGSKFTLAIGVSSCAIPPRAEGALRRTARRARHPRRRRRRGIRSVLSFAHPQATRLSAELLQRGVKTDARGDRLRLCADLLNTTTSSRRPRRRSAR